MVVVPPLLLATPQHTASTPRLARGFEPPPSKCSVARVAPAQFVVLARPLVPPVEWIDRDARAVLPHALPRTQTQTRRGPPSGGIA